MKLIWLKAQIEALEAKRSEAINGATKEQLEQAKGQRVIGLWVLKMKCFRLPTKYIIAPADMAIETISLKEGELLTPGYALFNGYKKSSVYFRFTIPEFIKSIILK